ncbi:TPA: hypothetical protein ACKRTE_002380 [Providencia rettgeri]
MNESLHAFWYRPFWQQTIPICTLICLCCCIGYFFYWQKNEEQLIELASENLNLIQNIEKETKLIQQYPALHHLERQIQTTSQPIEAENGSFELFSQLHTLLTRSNITLNQLQPVGSNTYFIEVQGNYPSIYHFMEQLLTAPKTHRLHYSEIKLTSKQGIIVASITISSINHPLIIKDDHNNE